MHLLDPYRLLLVLQLVVDRHGVDREVYTSLATTSLTRHVVVRGAGHPDRGEVLNCLVARTEVRHLAVRQVHHLGEQRVVESTLSKRA